MQSVENSLWKRLQTCHKTQQNVRINKKLVRIIGTKNVKSQN